MLELVAPRPWTRIHELAKATPGHVAVPYVGTSAASLLPLRKGSVLVTRMNRRAVKAGDVSPREILKLMRRGVSVHNVMNLHAKVYVFGSRALIGSANASDSSTRLIEACIETSERRVVAESKAFVLGLTGDAVGPETVKSWVKLYPGDRTFGGMPATRRNSRSVTAERSRLWIAPVFDEEWEEDAYRAAKKGLPKAKKRFANKKVNRLIELNFERSVPPWKLDDQIIRRWRNGRGFSFSAPARVLEIERYAGGAIMFLEERKHARSVLSARIRRELGATADVANYSGDRVRLVRSQETAGKLWHLWPIVARRYGRPTRA